MARRLGLALRGPLRARSGLLERSHAAWVYPVIYVYVEVMGALVLVQFWTLANELFNAREAKRLYGLIGAGGTFANIFIGLLRREDRHRLRRQRAAPLLHGAAGGHRGRLATRRARRPAAALRPRRHGQAVGHQAHRRRVAGAQRRAPAHGGAARRGHLLHHHAGGLPVQGGRRRSASSPRTSWPRTSATSAPGSACWRWACSCSAPAACSTARA